jgi:hypothetical protein
MKPINEVPIQRLHEVFDVSFDTGAVVWKIQTARCTKVGSLAGFKKSSGHLYVQIDGKTIALHRIVWAMFNGSWPVGILDHMNENPADNRICNLRIASKSQNGANVRRPQRNNKTGYKGVSLNKQTNKYRASMTLNGKHVHIGSFSTPEEAFHAYSLASARNHGEYSPFN